MFGPWGSTRGSRRETRVPFPGSLSAMMRSTLLLDQPASRRQSQAVAAARLLGGEEGLKGAAQSFGIHAATGVSHREFDARHEPGFGV